MRIYIASKYTAPTEEEKYNNALVQIDAAIELMRLGHEPFVPLLNHFLDARAREKEIVFTWDRYMQYCLEWLRQCDALLFLSESKGSLIELQMAKELGMPVFYSVEEVKEVWNFYE